jgi:parallel beta-helix repeat protein
MWQSELSFSGIKVEPKPGREQYISSNADGINLVNSGSGNTVSDCLVTYSGDDGISFSGNLYATVASVSGSNTIVVNERYKLKANQQIVFVDPGDLHEIGSATIQQEPQRQNGAATTIQLDRTFPDFKNGTLIFLPENSRSDGITIQNNTVRYPYSRGIYFSGVNGAQIIGNTIEHTQSCGILGQAEQNIPGVTNAVIKNNIINGAFEKGSTGQPGAIEISVEGKSTSAFVNKNITIVNNSITLGSQDPKHVGIYMANIKQYNLSNNTLQQKQANGALVNLSQVRSFGKGASVSLSN